jgi:tetratricopeptide (TPR) repeat protein
VYLRQGALAPAVAALDRAHQLSRAANDIWLQQIGSTLAAAHVARGEPEVALRLVEEIAPHAAALGHAGYPLGFGMRLAVQAEAYAAVGRMDEALRNGMAALDLFRTRKSHGYEAWTLYTVGRIHSRGAGTAPAGQAEEVLCRSGP